MKTFREPILGIIACSRGDWPAWDWSTVRSTLLAGRRAGVFTALGVASGEACWTLAASVGITALIVAS